MRVGIGYDVHPLVEGRPLIVGGVHIPYHKGLDGHSDADVLLHALCDALLGAAALGDIGQHFPDTDERWRGANSLELLVAVRQVLDEEGFAIENVDATVALQKPRLQPFLPAMRANLMDALAISHERISVKATTTERLGFVGEGAGAAAYAICLLSVSD